MNKFVLSQDEIDKIISEKFEFSLCSRVEECQKDMWRKALSFVEIDLSQNIIEPLRFHNELAYQFYLQTYKSKNGLKWNIGQTVYHKDVYKGIEEMVIVGISIKKNEVELEGDWSGGTHHIISSSWISMEGLSTHPLSDIKKIKKEKEYYIQNGWIGNSILWWAENSQGYTTEIDRAGKFSKEKAKKIIQRPEDKAWECEHVDNCLIAHKKIIDGQFLDNKKSLKGKRK